MSDAESQPVTEVHHIGRTCYKLLIFPRLLIIYCFDNNYFNCFKQLMPAVVYYVVKGVFSYFCCCRPFLLSEYVLPLL